MLSQIAMMELPSPNLGGTCLLHAVILSRFQGTVWYSLFKWPIVANLTSPLGYTASSLGNHELDDGVEDLVAYLRDTRDAYPTLSCNLELENEPGK